MKYKTYWVTVYNGHVMGVFTNPDDEAKYSKKLTDHAVGLTDQPKITCGTVPMICCSKCGEFPRMGRCRCPGCGAVETL